MLGDIMKTELLMYLMNKETKFGSNYIVSAKEGYKDHLLEQGNENSIVLEQPTLEEQVAAYKELKYQEGAVLYLIEPKELSPIWYSYVGVQTVIVTKDSDYYWNKYSDDYWFTNHTQYDVETI